MKKSNVILFVLLVAIPVIMTVSLMVDFKKFGKIKTDSIQFNGNTSDN